MSWWVKLLDQDGVTLDVDEHSEGGTYVLGGTTQAELNVTYNYSEHFCFRDLNGQCAKDTVITLAGLVLALGTKRDPDYWKPTEGNVGYCASILLNWAAQHPTGVWEVT